MGSGQVSDNSPSRFDALRRNSESDSVANKRQKIGEELQRELSEITPDRIDKQREFAVIQIKLAQKNNARILTYTQMITRELSMKAAIQFQSCMSREVLKLGKTMQRWRLSVPGSSDPPKTISLACLRKPRQIVDLQLYLDSPKAPMKLGIERRGMQVDERFALRHPESTRYFHRKTKNFGATSNNIIERYSSASSLWVESDPLYNCVNATKPLQHFLKLSWLHSQLSTAVQ